MLLGMPWQCCVCTPQYLLFQTLMKANFISTVEGSVTVFIRDVIKEKNVAATRIFSCLLPAFFD